MKIEKHIVKCPHCDKDVLDHMTECPFCHGELTPLGYNPNDHKSMAKARKISYAIFTLIAVALVVMIIVQRCAPQA